MHGYSSSEESDDPKRPRPLPASTSSTTDQKKRKKKKPPPQKAINRIWKKLQARKPTTPLAVLPFDPVPPPAVPDRANEPGDAGYERAAEECRRKVRKIIKECRRVNMRYRDPGWDLDWDLKMEKGHCLNYLGSETFEVAYPPASSASLPKSVKRVHEIFEKPTFLESVSSAEVTQGSLGNCWAVAALSALADVDDGIRRLCVEYDTRVGIYGFVFYRDGEWVYSIIDDKLYLKSPNWDSYSLQRQLLSQIDREDVEQHYRKTYQTGSKALFFGKNKDQNETWLPLLEKAYSKAHGDYASMIGGWIGECIEDMTGGVTTELLSSDILDVDAFWDDELSKVNQEFMFGCSTGLLDGGYGSRDGITERHAYVVMDAKTLKSGQRLLKLRNPWGKLRKGVWEGAYGDGSKEWTAEVQEELGHTFGNDSVFWIPYEDLLSKYQHLDRTRLFRDPGWRCCQRWVGVDVPWKPDYHEKFHIRLTRDSPLVLVISQLDRRYFKGLEGQYSFRLHFRLHELGRPGAEDYIVRSHGNYLMTRSVSIEVPDMPAGEYTVFLLVTAERHTSRPSTEDVVRRECKKRVANEKLAQVGYAYDLAHSKAYHHIEKVRQMRQSVDQGKASESRKAERRKQWEKRRTDGKIKKKQLKKNEAKKARVAAERAALLKKEEEKEKAEETVGELGDSSNSSDDSDDSDKGEAEAADAKPEEQKAAAGDQPAEEKPAEDKPVEVKPADSEEDPTTDDKTTQDKSADEKAEDKAVEDKAVEDTSANGKQPADDKSTGEDAERKEPEEALGNVQPPEPKLEDAQEAVSEKDKTTKLEDKPAETNESSKATTKSKSKSTIAAKKTTATAPSPSESIDYSSDSPVEDWEAIYSSDDYVRKPRTHPIPDVTADDLYPSEDDKLPEPWNAVCIVGLKVYSQDEDLELRMIMEGGALEEGGMGPKGERDLDNAQENAAGDRGDLKGGLSTSEPIVLGRLSTSEPIVLGEGTEQSEIEDGDDEEEGEEGKSTKKKKVEVKDEETEDKDDTEAKDENKEAAESLNEKEAGDREVETPDEVKSDAGDKEEASKNEAETPDQGDTKGEASDEKSSSDTDADALRKREEEMRRKEALIKKWEAEFAKKEEAMRKREEEMKRRAKEQKNRGEGDEQEEEEEEYIDCEENSSSSGMSTPDSSPFQEVKKEILG